ncbi:(2Fe-2S)-binding protein [Roseomonas sp. AR75]|uniref:(2Fe-2S)-binding protein n=1 Tax=Roseomonas sp. AR75 TaxID=2562311 RepID=UPI0010C11C33|nr:(2Fe-2S)-binding protein [Roseomonas sp. AR75]
MAAAPSDPPRQRLLRVAACTGPEVALVVDGQAVTAREGESVLSAVLGVVDHLRLHEVSGELRAGFCLMGACQDCWVWFADAPRGRACTTPVREGMQVFTRPPPGLLP